MADEPREVTTKALALLLAIVLLGIPFARFVKDRLEPERHHRQHITVQR